MKSKHECLILEYSILFFYSQSEDSDDEDQYALSDRWKYQFNIRRWSRKPNSPTEIKPDSDMVRLGSRDSLLTDHNSTSESSESPELNTKVEHKVSLAKDDYFGVAKSKRVTKSTMKSPKLRRSTSERLKGAKNLLKKMESFKSRKTKSVRNGNVVNISGPVITDKDDMQEKIKHLNCVSLNIPTTDPTTEANTVIDIDDTRVGDSINEFNESSVLVTNPDLKQNHFIHSPTPSSSISIGSPVSSTSFPLSPTSTGSASLCEISNTCSVKDVDTSSDDFLLSPDSTFDPASSYTKPEQFDVRRNQSDSNLKYSLSVSDIGFRPMRFPTELNSTGTRLYTKNSANTPEGTSSNCQTLPSSSSPQKIRRRITANSKDSRNRQSLYDNVPEKENLETAQKELDLILSKLFEDINDLNKVVNGKDAGKNTF